MLRSKSKKVILGLLLCLIVSGCSPSQHSSRSIVTSFYPLEYVTHQIAGDDFDVINVTPVGAEPHDLELSPRTTEKILDARLAIVMGAGFQPAVEKTTAARDGKTEYILDEILGSTSYDGVDPHVWLDPILYKEVVKNITDSLVAINPSKKKTYENRRDVFLVKLNEIDKKYSQAFSQCATKTFITSHDSFSRMAKRYGLVQASVAGTSPENEPSPQRLSDLAALAKKKHIPVIFTEDFVSQKVARSLSAQTGIRMQSLSPIEGLTEYQRNRGIDYFDIMNENLTKLTAALGCSRA